MSNWTGRRARPVVCVAGAYTAPLFGDFIRRNYHADHQTRNRRSDGRLGGTPRLERAALLCLTNSPVGGLSRRRLSSHRQETPS